MAEALDPLGRGTLVSPSEVQQPTYIDHCHQCGRPITEKRKDHSGHMRCDGGLVDDQIAMHHCNKELYEVLKKDNEHHAAFMRGTPRGVRPDPDGFKKKASGPCALNKYSHGCEHICSHPGGHFGFHECVKCRHLWL